MKLKLSDIRKHNPCEDSWKHCLKLLGKTKADNIEITFKWVIKNLGLDDAIWCLRVSPDPKMYIKQYCYKLLKSIENLLNDKRSLAVIKAFEDEFSGNKIDWSVVKSNAKFADAAYTVAAAAAHAAYAAAYAADAASASYSGFFSEREKQVNILLEVVGEI